MDIYLYGIYDSSVGQFTSFFTAESDDFAKRSFIMSWTTDKKYCSMFGSNHNLMRIGCVSCDSGTVSNIDNLPLITLEEAFKLSEAGVFNDN